jgi:hypothetical protein
MSDALAAAAVAVTDILAAENAALAALDLRRAAALLPVKSHAAERFAAACADAGGAHPAGMHRLAALAAENRRLLQHAIAVQGRVIELVANALPRALPDATARYGARGTATPRHFPAIAMSSRV